MKKLPNVICLMGPTASGKTKLAVELMQKKPFEIVSVDSVMIYRGMNIGSAKPDAATLKIAPHHLIDICDPRENYSAANFLQDAKITIDEILSRQKIPLLVGGTMMYFNALKQGLSSMPSCNAIVRKEINEQSLLQGWPSLHQKLQTIDPIAAAKINPNDAQRIQRALEVWQLTGKTITEHQQQKEINLNDHYNFQWFALIPPDRALLHQRIEQRFIQMLRDGLIEETQQLFNRGDLHENLPSIRAVGYRQAWSYLKGEYSYQEMSNKAIAATRQFAKRQLTWLKSWENLTIVTDENFFTID